MTDFFERTPIMSRHSTAVLFRNHAKPTLNTRLVKNNTCFFVIFPAFRVIKRSTHWPNRSGCKRANSHLGAIEPAVSTGPTDQPLNRPTLTPPAATKPA
jgi:hypothetical protein